MEKMYTTKEVAEVLEIPVRKVRALIHNGLIKAERGPRRIWLISEGNLFWFASLTTRYEGVIKRHLGMRYTIWKFGLMALAAPYGMLIAIRKGKPTLVEEVEE